MKSRKLKLKDILLIMALFIAIGMMVDSYAEMKSEQQRYENSEAVALSEIIMR